MSTAATIPFPTIALRCIREEDLSIVKGPFGKPEKVALTRDEMAECQCCGRRIKKVFHLDNGLAVGTECEAYLCAPIMRMGRKNRKADAILAALAEQA